MNKSKLLIAILMAVVLCFAFAACGGGESEEATGDSAADTLVMSIPADTGTLNPHTYDSPMWIQSLVYDGLTRYVDGEVVPALAESWEVSPDSLVYTFNLREGVTFTDGSALNADIVKKNLDAILLHKAEHEWMESVNQMKEVVVVDEMTVQIILEKPFSAMLQELALARPLRIGAEAIFPESGDTAEGINEPIGSGRWIQKEHVEGQYTIFERNENYWGEKPSYKYLKVVVIPDINTAVSSLQAGEIDLIYDVEGQMTGDTYNELQSAGMQTVQSDPITTFDVLVNSDRGETQDINVRKALQHAIDKVDIAENVFYGLQTPADTLMSTSTPYCDVEQTIYEYDLEKAAEYLETAGWVLEDGAQYRTKDGEELVLSYMYQGDNESSKIIGQVLQNQLLQVGVNVELVAQEAQAYGEAQKTGDFEMMLVETWGDPFDPHSFFSSFRNPTHGDYAAQLGLPMKAEIDAAISEALNSTDDEVTQEKYTYVIQTLSEQAVYIPLTYTTRLAAFGENVSGIEFNTTSDVPTERFQISK